MNNSYVLMVPHVCYIEFSSTFENILGQFCPHKQFSGL